MVTEPLRLHARGKRLQLVEEPEVDRVGAADRQRHPVHDDGVSLGNAVEEMERPPFRVDEVLRHDLEPVHFRPFRRDMPEMLRAQPDPQSEVRESPSIRPGGRPAHVSRRHQPPWCDMSTGTLQPPLPLQEFLPAHPASPPLQPPWPLHAFWPAHSCLAFVAQPPLPLQEFLPAQPLSPPLQPPLPLHALWPLQTWFSPPASSPAYATFASSAPARRPPVTPNITLPKSRRFIAMSFPS